MDALAIVAIVLLGLLCVVLFLVLPLLALVKALPEMRRMVRVRVDDPPINLGRAFGRWLERNDRRNASEHRASRERNDLDR